MNKRIHIAQKISKRRIAFFKDSLVALIGSLYEENIESKGE